MRIGKRDVLNKFMADDVIFNQDNCEYYPIEKFVAFKKSDNGVSVTCCLSNGRRINLLFSFFKNNVLRIRLGRKKVNRFNSIRLDMPENAVNVKYNLNAKQPSISCDKIRLVFDTDNVLFRLFRKDEELLDYNQANEMAWFGYITYQCGLGRDENGREFAYFTHRLLSEERIYGGGEQYGEIDQRGRQLKGWITDTLGMNSTKMIYKWIPFFMSSRKYGIFFNSPAQATAEIGSVSFNAASFKFMEPSLDIFIFAQDSLKNILQQYTALTGRPPIIPDWSYGIWLSRCAYTHRNQVEEAVDKTRSMEFPADVINVDPWWLKNREKSTWNANDFIWSYERFPDPKGFCKSLHDRNIKLCLWVNPYLWTRTGIAQEHQYLALRDKGGDIVTTPMSHDQAIYDLTEPLARKFFKAKLKELLEIGVDVFKTDYGENIPSNAIFACGDDGIAMHNIYPYIYNELVYETTREVMGDKAIVFGRSGFAGSQRFPVYWSGDSQATWDVGHNVLCSGLNAAISGMAYWSCDIGGFVGQPEDELYLRWAQFGLLISHSRFHGCGYRDPWMFPKKIFEMVKKFALLRYRLITYLHNLGLEANRMGLPVLRPMVLEFEDDPICQTMSSQYMLGHALLIKPILQKGIKQVQVYLPEGRWLDFWTNSIYEGPGFITLKADLDTIPIFQRANTVIPFNQPMQYVDLQKFNKFSLQAFDLKNADYKFYAPNMKLPLHVKTKPKKGLHVYAVSRTS